MLDLLNKQFGDLKVIKFAGMRKRPDGRSNSWWKVKCKCGNIKQIAGVYLTRKSQPQISCGCRRGGPTHRLSYSTEYVLWHSAKTRAKQSNLKFTIKVTDIQIPKICPLLCFPLKSNRKGKPASTSPSLDRINPTKGYTLDNIWIISHRANAAKRDLSLKELKLLVENLEQKLIEQKLNEKI